MPTFRYLEIRHRDLTAISRRNQPIPQILFSIYQLIKFRSTMS